MTDKDIIDAAKAYEKSTGFGDIVLKAKGVNSAAGIGFLEGAVWMQEQMMKGALVAVINSKENDLILYQSLPAFITKNSWHRGDKVKLIVIKEAEKCG